MTPGFAVPGTAIWMAGVYVAVQVQVRAVPVHPCRAACDGVLAYLLVESAYLADLEDAAVVAAELAAAAERDGAGEAGQARAAAIEAAVRVSAERERIVGRAAGHLLRPVRAAVAAVPVRAVIGPG